VGRRSPPPATTVTLRSDRPASGTLGADDRARLHREAAVFPCRSAFPANSGREIDACRPVWLATAGTVLRGRKYLRQLASMPIPRDICCNKERLEKFDSAMTIPFLLGVQPGENDDVVTRGSFFGELSHITAYASCASAAQGLRNRFRTYREGGIVDAARVGAKCLQSQSCRNRHRPGKRRWSQHLWKFVDLIEFRLLVDTTKRDSIVSMNCRKSLTGKTLRHSR